MSTIFHKMYGGGYPLIFLHGFCETHFVWHTLIDDLQENFQVITLDLPGFGNSPILEEGFSIDDVAWAVKEKLDELGVKQCIMIGHSLGGYVTMSFVRQFPDQVDGFCLFNSTVFEDTPDKKENRNKLIDLINRSGTAGFIQSFIPSLFFENRLSEFSTVIEELKSDCENVHPKAVTGYAAAMRDRNDEKQTLLTNKEKALIIAGKEDKNVPEKVSLEMGSIIGMDNFHLLEKTAHMAMFENQDLTISLIQNFADKLSDR